MVLKPFEAGSQSETTTFDATNVYFIQEIC